MKSKLKVKNRGYGVLISCFLVGFFGSAAFLRARPEERVVNRRDGVANYQESQVIRAKKILNEGLFEAIKQGSLRGVTFLVEGGADPEAKNRCGRTPLNFAEYVAKKSPEELDRQAIIDFLRALDSERYTVDDATIIATARKIYGLNGGVLKGIIQVGKALAKVAKKVVPAKAAQKIAKSKVVKKAVESGAQAVKKSLPKSLAKAVPSTERIVNTLEDCLKYLGDMIEKGIFRKDIIRGGRQSYGVMKNSGELKKGDLLIQDNRHYEWELFDAGGKHRGAIDPKTGTIYKPADPTRQISTK
jgi:hypothetical protein